ncbi:MAG: hypothetical protein HY787_13405 [Deltaproteobacteria bacterium]|nr:hypothetical protein [Deltaproteobacteria bacterium]
MTINENKKDAISKNLQTQWQDHFHMRDQTWKVLQYSILFFLGVVGLEIKQVNTVYLVIAYGAAILTSLFGFFIAIHHRRRQKEKFEIIAAHEHELEIDILVKPILEKSHTKWLGRINTSTFIVIMQASLFILSSCLLVRLLIS